MKSDTKDIGMRPFSQVREKLLKNPAVQKAYENYSVILESARFVRRLRESAGMTQQQLAERMGVSQAIIGRLETGAGRRGMTIEMLARVASACGSSLLVRPVPAEYTPKQKTADPKKPSRKGGSQALSIVFLSALADNQSAGEPKGRQHAND